MALKSVRASFWIKPALAYGLVSAADLLFFDKEMGASLGLFAALLVGAVVISQPAVLKAWTSRLALLAAFGLALLLVEAPGSLEWTLFWASLSIAVLAPRARPDDGVWGWSQRLLVLPVLAAFKLAKDVRRLRRHQATPGLLTRRSLPILALPVAGGLVFATLFAAANPIIDTFLAQLHLPPLDIFRLVFWLIVLIGVWTILRPRHLRRTLALPVDDGARALPGVSVESVGLSLVVFNLLFLIQNGLDIAILWSGAPLPRGVTLADYAHSGAYPLIATALLAGLFVLVALRPGSATAKRPWLRRLVVLWVAQNLFLVGSSILRTADYIEAYSLTRLRIAALIWMAIVGVGLLLICWRMLRGKSAYWLINANAAAAGLVLLAAAVGDLGAVAANWNVDHARESGGKGAALDLCYLGALGDSAVVALARLETRPGPADLRERVAYVRAGSMADLALRQTQWRSWTWRGHRRLQQARTILAASAPVGVQFGARTCEGRMVLPPRPPPTAPLTSAAAS